MNNLAGDTNATNKILEELYLAGIPAVSTGCTSGEVPSVFVGKLGKWTFTRRWTYWAVGVGADDTGLPLDKALELHWRRHPFNYTILGSIIRSGGHCAAPSPDEYGADPVYNEDLYDQLKALHEYKEVIVGGLSYPDIAVGTVSRLCNEGHLKVDRYVDCYHIDELIGLKEFAKTISDGI